jgi:hypothetical protein
MGPGSAAHHPDRCFASPDRCAASGARALATLSPRHCEEPLRGSNPESSRGKILDCFRLRQGFGGQVAALAMTEYEGAAGSPSCTVIPRESGESSTPQLLDSTTAVSAYWIARLPGDDIESVAAIHLLNGGLVGWANKGALAPCPPSLSSVRSRGHAPLCPPHDSGVCGTQTCLHLLATLPPELCSLRITPSSERAQGRPGAGWHPLVRRAMRMHTQMHNG